MEAFHVYLYVGAYTALYAWLPYIMYSVWAFVSPSLFTFEKKRWAYVLLCALLCVYLSWYIVYVGILPHVTSFFMSTARETSLVTLDMEPRLSSYTTFSMALACVGHVCMGLPLVVVTMGVGLQRSWVYVLSVCAVACVCPPDPAMQGVLTCGVLCGAEGCLFLSVLAHAYREGSIQTILRV